MNAPSAVFRGATVIVGSGEVIEEATIVVRDGVIADVRSGVALQSDDPADVIDLSGAVVMPTILNFHGHIGYLKDGLYERENFTRENVLDHLRRLAYYGVSVFQSLGSDRDDLELSIRNAQREGELDTESQALLLSASTGIVAPTPGSENAGADFAADVLLEVSDPAEADAAVDLLAGKQPDHIKVWIDDRWDTKAVLDAATVDAIVARAHHHGIRVIAHVYSIDDATRALDAGADGFAHMIRTPGVDRAFAERVRDQGVVVCSSIGIHRNFFPDVSWLDEPWVTESVTSLARAQARAEIAEAEPWRGLMTDSYDTLLAEAALFDEVGAELVMSVDTGLSGQFFGVAEHRELEALVLAGLSPAHAIIAATSRPARLLGLDDRGEIAVGRRADLLVLDANPLDDITNTRRIRDVYLAGHRLDREALRSTWTGTDAGH